MVFYKSLGFLVFWVYALAVWADELAINPEHPQQYTVKKNDTLWDISAQFLKNPWEWRTLWHSNPQIHNPDLIYPGDTLVFATLDGKPSLRLKKGELSLSKEKKLKPSIRQSALDDDAIKMIPADVVMQFLDASRVVGKDDLDKAPYIVAFVGEHFVGGASDKVYVRNVLEPETLSYTVYRKGEAFVSPETKEILGYEALYIADATLEKEGDPAKLLLTKATQDVRIGDRILPTLDDSAVLNYFPTPPEKDIQCSIIAVLNGVTQIGRYNVVVLDKGSVDGLKVGHLLSVYQSGRVIRDRIKSKEETVLFKLPDDYAGSLMIFRIFERVSYALVMDAVQAIHLFDKVQTP